MPSAHPSAHSSAHARGKPPAKPSHGSAATVVPETDLTGRLGKIEIGCALGVVLAVFIAFWPALGAGFLNWDDYGTITTNERFRGLDPARLQWMFTTGLMGHYQPLAWVTLAIDHTFWGMRPFGYHLTNVLLHALNAVLVGVLANRLMRLARGTSAAPAPNALADVLAATLAALLFGVHPMRVESVAWITERRDVLSTFFALLCVLAHLRFAGLLARGHAASARRWYFASLAMLLLAMLSKAIVVVLPAALLALDAYPLRRLSLHPREWLRDPSRRTLLEKIPHALLAATFAYIILNIQQTLIEPLRAHDPIARLAQAAYGLAYYPRASVWPVHLLPIYELPMPVSWKQPAFAMSMVAVVLALGAIAALSRRAPALAVACVCYLVFVLPVSGLLQTGPQLAADRYSYVSMIGFIIVLAAAWSKWMLASKVEGVRNASVIIAGVAVLALGVMTWRYASLWRSSMQLWAYTLSIDEDHALGHSLMGAALVESKRPLEAMPHLRRALELRPGLLEASYTLSRTAFTQGDLEEAERVAREGLTHWPGNVTLERLVGDCRLWRDDWAGAAVMYEKVLATDPNIASVHANLGKALGEMGRIDAAMTHLQRAAELQPERPQTFILMARLTWTHKRDAEQARKFLLLALQRDPRNAAAMELMAQIDAAAKPAPR